MKTKFISIIKNISLFVILNFILVACTELNQFGDGMLIGKISIGPLCPVETDPPNPACLPTMETYKAWQTAVWSLKKKTKIIDIIPEINGNYALKLPAGEYIVDYAETKTNRIGASNLPGKISIIKGDTTNLDIDIDTGIR